MGNEFRREQHYAVSKDGVLAHIKKAHYNSEDYYCPHCGCRMLKRCGKIRAWHFAHDWRYADELQKNCSYETYLHGYAKLRLKQWFDESDSIVLHYQQSIIRKLRASCGLKHDNCSLTLDKFCDLKNSLTFVRLNLQLKNPMDVIVQTYCCHQILIFLDIY